MTDTIHTVLVVDDEPEILESLRRQLRRESYRLVTTTSPLDALERIAEGEVDVLLADIDMPDMNGLELVARVRREHPGVVRMLLTGDASLPSALDAINRGEVHRYLTKPWDRDGLRDALRQALERLDELRRAADAESAIARREAMLEELAAEHPGIRDVSLRDGVYAIDAASLEELRARISDPTLRAFCAGEDELEDLGPTENEA